MGRQKWKEALIDKSELRKIWKGVLDNLTILTIHKLIEKGYIKEILSIVKEGKESKIFSGINKNSEPIAIKVYATNAGNFKRMYQYIIGDKRFQNIKQNRKSIIYAWCRKEFVNTSLANQAGILCPKPYVFMNNVYVMSFIGEYINGTLVPAPRLSDVEIENLEEIFNQIISDIKKAYSINLIHGDLSEFNILIQNNKPYIIDWSQSVLSSHPNAKELLERDIKNICLFFKRKGLKCQEEEIIKIITQK
ncbi:MAG: serine protein kinase RIO [Candidatus Aenigmarchaeota archaeon]|nr:serine protein kinase RIO [Candidatus Aenigmarchaeota archaeon]